MKRIFIVIGILLFFSLYSCSLFDNNDYSDSDNPKGSFEEVKNDTVAESLNDSIALLKGQLDESVAKIDSIQQELTAVKDLQEKSRKENRWNWVWNILIVVSLIAAIIAIYLATKNLYIEDDIDNLNGEISNLKQKLSGLQQGSNNYLYRNSNNDVQIINQITELENSVRNIQLDLNEIRQGRLNVVANNHIQHQDISEKNNQRTLYFRNIIGHKYFRNQDSRDQAVFEANVNGKHGTFIPISLQVVKGNDNALDAIDIEQGSVPIPNASQMSVIFSGITEYKDNEWYIKSKAKIKFI